MKTLAAVLTLSVLFAPSVFAQSAEQVGKELITAYQKKDAAGVKKHMAPMLAAMVDKKFFDDKQIAAEVAALQKWNGKVREARYYANKFGVLAAVYYDEAADPAKVRVFQLIKSGKTWKHGMQGFSVMEKARFLAYEKNEASVKPLAADKKDSGAQKKPADDNAPNKGYSVEMADGNKVDAPSAVQVKNLLARLNDDNFFLTLTGPSGFMQAGYTAKGLDMQYKDSYGHFASEGPVPAEQAAAMFKAYLAGDKGWKSQCGWKPFE